jgi:AAA+ ATPase superfamily predicted ATPase
MFYFIFQKNLDDLSGTIYKIAENLSDLNNLNISKDNYKIIDDSKEKFDLVKFGNKSIEKYNNNTITYIDQTISFDDKNQLQINVNSLKQQIKQFTDVNPNHPLFSRWNSYYNQLNNLDLDSITYPLSKSLEQYFNDLGQPSYNILQLP